MERQIPGTRFFQKLMHCVGAQGGSNGNACPWFRARKDLRFRRMRLARNLGYR